MRESISIHSNLIRYLTKKIVRDIKGNSFSELSKIGNEILSSFKLVDAIREQLNENYVPNLLNVYETEFAELKGLFITLMKDYINDPSVFSFLKKRWENSNDFKDKNRIMYRLIEAEDNKIDQTLYMQFYDFINDNWDDFINSVRFRCNGEDNVMEYVNNRLSNTNFPKKKDWIYLYCSFASNNKEEINELIDNYEDYKSPFENIDIINEIKNKLNAGGKK